MKTIFDVDEIIQHAREFSPFYRKLYGGLGDLSLERLPIVNQKDFWDANSYSGNTLLTGKVHDGVVFKSGGTTGNPKFSVFNKEEWETFTRIFGEGMASNGVKKGDRVGNLFYSGDLYASFLFITKSLESCPIPTVHFPMTGAMDTESIVKTIEEFGINVLAGVPTSFINIAHYLLKKGKVLKLDTILYGGESMYSDQVDIVSRAFPGAKINSVGYASVDGGHLGFFTEVCKRGEHEVFLESSIMELIDEETEEEILETGKQGKLVYTNLTRKLMPIIKYPVGDLAEWVEMTKVNGRIRGKRFILKGRSEEGARIGPVTVSGDDLRSIFLVHNLADKISNFQLLVERKTGRDRLVVNIVEVPNSDIEPEKLLENFYSERPMYLDAVEQGLISPVEFKLVSFDDLIKNPRTGKLKSVVDLR